MIYTTFEQTDYGFVLLDINKKQSDKNWFWKVKIFKYETLRTVTTLAALFSYYFQYLVSFTFVYLKNLYGHWLVLW